VRRTRSEQRAHTRHCLMEAAAKVFSRRGLLRGSIDEVAEEAGYTKGAFYANFRSKEELFLAMLDERFAAKLGEIEEVLRFEDGVDIEDRARRHGADFTAAVRSDPEWERLFFEFAVHAMRDEDFRAELVTRYGSLREALTRALAAFAERDGVVPPFPAEHIALMVFAMANGFALEKTLEPDTVPDDLYGSMLLAFFTGLRTLADERLDQTAGASRAASR
jgi:AcrR family transcriptional regulator